MAPAQRPSAPPRAFWAIAGIYLVLGQLYSTFTPVGEGIDEPGHIVYVQFMQEHHRIPGYEDAQGLMAEQVKHPPLYYLVLALATAGGSYDGLTWVSNPHCCNLERPSPAVLRHPEGDLFPYAPAYRTVRLARLVTLLLGLAALWGTWAATRLVFPARRELALASTACLAFQPQFLAMATTVNNDGLANPLGALALWAALAVALEGARRRDLALLGVFVGLGLVTKLTMLAWLAVAALAVAIAAWRLRSARVLGRATLWLGGTLALTCGWWFVRNLVVKGDLLGWGKWVRSAGVVWRKVPFQTQLPDYFAIQWQSFWGSFGWVTVRMPDPVYRLLLVVTVLALLGLLGASARWWRAWRAGRAEARPAWAALVIGSAALLVYASVFQLAFTFDLTVAQGRYLFTALPAFLIAFTVGLVSLAPRSRAPQAATAVATGMLVLALYACFGVLRPTFRPPDRLSPADLAALDPGLRLRFGRDIELLGAELPRGGIRAGEDLPVGLIWRTARWIDEGEVVFVHLVDRAGRMLARADFLPRQGLYPTVLWYPNWPWRDRLSLPVAADAPAGAADLLVGLYPDGEPQRGLPASVDGRILGDHATVGRVMVRALEPERVPAAAMARGDILGFTDRSGIWKDLLRLEAFQVFAATDPSSEEPGADGATAVDIVFYWRALDALPEDYTVFVHALAPDGSQLAGADGPPGQGRFPSSLWAAGDLMADRHQVILPREAREADIRWQVGLYLPATGARLPARNAQGQPWADGAILLQP
jgi:4-amino-4-deoxy-L-arabinose transferase-like glycosyltransferase